MLGSIKKRSEYGDYARAVDDCLKLLFCNFPEGHAGTPSTHLKRGRHDTGNVRGQGQAGHG